MAARGERKAEAEWYTLPGNLWLLAAPVAYALVRHLSNTFRLAYTQGWNRNVLAKVELLVYASS